MSRILACLIALAPIILSAQDAHLNFNDPDIAAIAKLNNDYAHILADGDFDRLADFYSLAAVYIADGEPPVDRNIGKAVTKHWRKILNSGQARIVLHIEDVDASGELAYDRVSYTVTNTRRSSTSVMPGQETVSREQLTSHSIDILRKEDGVWKFYRVITTTSFGDK